MLTIYFVAFCHFWIFWAVSNQEPWTTCFNICTILRTYNATCDYNCIYTIDYIYGVTGLKPDNYKCIDFLETCERGKTIDNCFTVIMLHVRVNVTVSQCIDAIFIVHIHGTLDCRASTVSTELVHMCIVLFVVFLSRPYC